MIIDAHHHLWNRSAAAYSWLGPHLPTLDRDVAFAELEPMLDEAGVDRTVLVQAADNSEDTDFMLAQADASDGRIAGVVGWIPLDDPEQATSRLRKLRQHPAFCGIRHGINNETDPEWLLRPEVLAGLRLLEAERVPFDLVSVRRRHLSLVPELVEQVPDLEIVIDHLSKPPIRREEREPWWTNISLAARSPHVWAKLSGLMPARGDLRVWDIEDLKPFVDRALEVFGAERLMWGSDWPIIDLAGGYIRAFDAVQELAVHWTSAERDAIFGGNAARFYGIDL